MQLVILGLIFVGIVTYIANVQQVSSQPNYAQLQSLLIVISALGIVLGFYVIFAAVVALTPDTSQSITQDVTQLPEIEILPAMLFWLLSMALGIFSIAVVMSYKVRQWIEQIGVRSDGIRRRYRANSLVHTTAIVLAMFQIVNTIGGFVMSGGIEGLAQDLETQGFTTDMLLSNFFIYVLMALLGVGLFIRRDWSQVQQRLGLEMPAIGQMWIGAGVGFGLFWMQVAIMAVWTTFTSPETIAQQTAASEQIFQAFSGSLFAALLLALTTGIGEEMLFRGAIQPIFGMVWTSIFFTLLHTQYTLTPAALIIFIVSMSFAWLRRHYNTSTAMAAHFIYNFLPFLLYWAASQIPVQTIIP